MLGTTTKEQGPLLAQHLALQGLQRLSCTVLPARIEHLRYEGTEAVRRYESSTLRYLPYSRYRTVRYLRYCQNIDVKPRNYFYGMGILRASFRTLLSYLYNFGRSLEPVHLALLSPWLRMMASMLVCPALPSPMTVPSRARTSYRVPQRGALPSSMLFRNGRFHFVGFLCYPATLARFWSAC